MKIAHIAPYPPKDEKHGKNGGVASYTKNLLTSMNIKSSDEIFILCNKINDRTDRYTENGITIIRCFDKKPIFARQILKEIKILQPDVIHIQQELSLYGSAATAYLLQWLLFRLRNQNTVITLHGVVSIKRINKDFVRQNNSNLPTWIIKLAFLTIYKPITVWAKHIIVHEDYFKQILANEYRVSANKIDVIRHGVEDFRAIPKERACHILGLNSKKDIVLFMGYQTGYKGLDLLIEGFALYLKSNPNLFLVIGAGKHPKLRDDQKYLLDYMRLQKKARKRIGKENYVWAGFIEEENTRNYYSACDVSVYPYTVAMSSSGPMSFAIGHEKPFLASSVFADVFCMYQPILFDRTPKALANKLDNYFASKDIFKKISKDLKKDRLWSKVAAQTVQLYKKIYSSN